MEIGGFTTTRFRAGATVDYFPLFPNFFWVMKIEAFRVGTADTFADGGVSAYKVPNSTKAVMDSGTSFIYAPKSVYSKFVNLVMRDKSILQTQGYTLGPCDVSLYESIFFYVDGRYIEVTPAAYVLDVYSGISNKCYLAIAQNSKEYWLMGDAFLREYVSIWDKEAEQLGLVPHDNTTASIHANALLPMYQITVDNSTDNYVDTFTFDYP